jgi:ribulose bisphosphate carboxylase small subunit
MVKERREMLPIRYVRIIGNDPEIVKHELMMQNIQVRKKWNQGYQDGQEYSGCFR